MKLVTVFTYLITLLYVGDRFPMMVINCHQHPKVVTNTQMLSMTYLVSNIRHYWLTIIDVVSTKRVILTRVSV